MLPTSVPSFGIFVSCCTGANVFLIEMLKIFCTGEYFSYRRLQQKPVFQTIVTFQLVWQYWHLSCRPGASQFVLVPSLEMFQQLYQIISLIIKHAETRSSPPNSFLFFKGVVSLCQFSLHVCSSRGSESVIACKTVHKYGEKCCVLPSNDSATTKLVSCYSSCSSVVAPCILQLYTALPYDTEHSV